MGKKSSKSKQKQKRKRRRAGASAQSGFAPGPIGAGEEREDEPQREKILRGSENQAVGSEEAALSELEGDVRRARVVAVRGADIALEAGAGRGGADDRRADEAADPGGADGATVVARLRKSTRVPHRDANAIAVGDYVLYLAEGEEPYVVTEVLARRKSLARVRRGREEQVIAANVDAAAVVSTAAEPPFKPRLVDRYLISIADRDLEPILVLNKIDLVERDTVEPSIAPYRALGLPVFPVSAHTGEGLDELRAAIGDRTVVFSGQSGVGKSSILSRLLGRELETQDVYGKLGKGRHTTTNSTLYRLPEGDGAVIDTPGIRSFLLHEPTLESLHRFFPEVAKAGEECRFHNCRHAGDAGCAVPAAVEAGAVHPDRLDSYQVLRQEIEDGGTRPQETFRRRKG